MGLGSCCRGYKIIMQTAKTTKVRQVQSQAARMLDAIVAEVDVKSLKPIRPFDLKNLGYLFHDTPKVFFKKPCELRMVLDEDTKREVDFSFLLNTESNKGLVVPNSFTHFMETPCDLAA